MSRKSKLIAVFGPLVLAAAVFVVAAIGASGGGTADQVKFKTGANASTPSGSFLDVPGAAVTVTPTVGSQPLVIRFTAAGYEQDFNSGGGFAGHKYAAMLVRVLVNGSQVGPVVRLFDNVGKVGVQKPRPTTTSYEWATTVTGGAAKQVKVQFKNLHTFDNANINSYTLSAQFH